MIKTAEAQTLTEITNFLLDLMVYIFFVHLNPFGLAWWLTYVENKKYGFMDTFRFVLCIHILSPLALCFWVSYIKIWMLHNDP